jgi:hypothetical protein
MDPNSRVFVWRGVFGLIFISGMHRRANCILALAALAQREH